MKYSRYPPEVNSQLKNWTGGHTGTFTDFDCPQLRWLNPGLRVDLGSFTLLFRQPVAALQIRYPSTNEWKWVKPQDATITVNACDALQFLTAGYVKSTVHR